MTRTFVPPSTHNVSYGSLDSALWVEGTVGDVVLDQAVCRKLRLDSILQVVGGLVVQDLEVVDVLHLDPVPRKSFNGNPLNDGTLDDGKSIFGFVFGFDEDPVPVGSVWVRHEDDLVLPIGLTDQANEILLDAYTLLGVFGPIVYARHDDDSVPR